jgi:hypothetical protein
MMNPKVGVGVGSRKIRKVGLRRIMNDVGEGAKGTGVADGTAVAVGGTAVGGTGVGGTGVGVRVGGWCVAVRLGGTPVAVSVAGTGVEVIAVADSVGKFVGVSVGRSAVGSGAAVVATGTAAGLVVVAVGLIGGEAPRQKEGAFGQQKTGRPRGREALETITRR